jgi:hypothetical protein
MERWSDGKMAFWNHVDGLLRSTPSLQYSTTPFQYSPPRKISTTFTLPPAQ